LQSDVNIRAARMLKTLKRMRMMMKTVKTR